MRLIKIDNGIYKAVHKRLNITTKAIISGNI